jgi:hypothetical protein
MTTIDSLNQWANDNMALLVTGLIVVLAASVLIIRALRRAKAVRDGMSVEQRDRRARRLEDALTVAVAVVASGLSLTGLWRYAEDVLHLNGWWRATPYFGLDAAVIVCAIRARRRARNNEAAGWNGRLVWIFALISAAFGFSEGGSLWGGFGRAVWPLIAATLFELGLIEQRHAAQRNVERRLNLGWAHPIERLRVYSMLSSDSTLTADQATHEVRVNAAARAMYRLRHAAAAVDDATETDVRWARARMRRVERRTQRALLRAGFADQHVAAEVLQRTQAMVRTREFAQMDYSADSEARAMLLDAIDHTVLPAQKRARPARKPQGDARAERATESAPSATPARTSAQTTAQTTAQAGARSEEEERVRAEVHRRIAAGEPVVAAHIRRDLGIEKHRATVQRYVNDAMADAPAPARAQAPEPDRAQATEQQPGPRHALRVQEEIHAADPPRTDPLDAEVTTTDDRAATVA